MTLFRPLCLAAAIAAVAAPAHAREQAFNVPGGSVEDVAILIARQAGTSVVITDRGLATRRIAAVRGTYSARGALQAVAQAAGARLVRAGDNAWRLEPGKPALAQVLGRPKPHRAPPPPVPAPPGAEIFDDKPIVVVGSKRDMALRDFPGQVSLLSGEDLQFGGVGGTDRIAARVASVSTTHLGSGRNKLFIRGIADSSFTGPTQSTVGQYLGDLRLSYNSPDPDLRLSDLESVEVLEGPQGTLYGAGSLGGIVRLIPNSPKLDAADTAGQIGTSLTAHGKPGLDGNLMVNLPLLQDRIGLRVSIDGELQGGYINKPLLRRDDVNRTTVGAGRAILRYDLGDGWTADLIGVTQRIEGDDSQYADRKGTRLASQSADREGHRTHYSHSQLVVDGKLGAVHLRSTTGLAWQDLTERYDATPPEGDSRLFVQNNRTRMAANETRAWVPLGDSFGWVLGTSLINNRTHLLRELGPPEALESSTGVTNEITEFTLYGEASLRLREGLVATAGGRVTWSQVSGSGENVPFAVAVAGSEVTAERSARRILPSAAITAQPLPQTTIYLRYQEGFRPGGLAIDAQFVRRFRNDHTSTYELGLRQGQPGRGKFDLSASVSYTNWRDIQADFIDLLGLPTTANVGDGRIWTVSVSTGYSPIEGLRLDGGIVYNSSHISQPNLYVELLGRRRDAITEIPNVAKFAARLGFDYRRQVGSELDLHVQGWARYVGRSRLGVGPELGDLQGDYLDSAVTARLGNDRLGATLSLSNLTDTAGNRFSLGTPFAVGREQVTPLRPLTLRLGADARF